MPSFRKRVTSYFRQLSFHNESREKRNNINENTFVTKYLQGLIVLQEGPPIIYGKNPTDLPNYELGCYQTGPNTVRGCYSGPNGGLTTVKRTEKHLSILDPDIDFIDTHDEEVPPVPKTNTKKRQIGQPIDNTTMVIKVAGHEYCVTNKPKRHSKSHSLGSISDFGIEIEKTKIDKSFYSNNNNSETVECKNIGNNQSSSCNNKTGSTNNCSGPERKPNNVDVEANRELVTKVPHGKDSRQKPVMKNSSIRTTRSDKQNYGLSKSKSDGNPFHHKRKGRIIKVDRPNLRDESNEKENIPKSEINDSSLPNEWNRKTDFFYGISDSLYDRNQVTKYKNGDPIADCFGLIARDDSAILAVADGVNWGEKASIAAKSAIHGSLHYLNKTIFNDTKPFENLTTKTDESSISSSSSMIEDSQNLISNTREVFVCLLRAFSCAHDLILENKGMLTTLTVAVILPLKQKLKRRSTDEESWETQYVCCVCNVGDTLAYVYSQKYGVRELTKGSHDINCNRDMRDALGALGPVDGINPELSNLTLSVTTLHKGDIVMVASDGLTDNFDPNVCKFTVNTTSNETAAKSKQRPSTTTRPLKGGGSFLPLVPAENVNRSTKDHQDKEKKPPPIKPPRKSQRNSVERSSIRSGTQERISTVDQNTAGSPSDNSKSNIPNQSVNEDNPEVKTSQKIQESESSAKKLTENYENPLVAQFMRENSLEDGPKSMKQESKMPVAENKASSLRRQTNNSQQDASQKPSTARTLMENKERRTASTKRDDVVGYKFLRSKTSVDIRSPVTLKPVVRNEDGIPYITPIQRYELQLLLIEDILRHGISGKDTPCTSARKLCENLVSYTISITSAKRHTLEDQDLYFDNRNGVLMEVSNQEKKMRRKKGLEKVQTLPGKLDHVTVVAYNVGNFAY